MAENEKDRHKSRRIEGEAAHGGVKEEREESKRREERKEDREEQSRRDRPADRDKKDEGKSKKRGGKKKRKRGGRKHKRLARLAEDPFKPVHRALSTRYLDSRPALERRDDRRRK